MAEMTTTKTITMITTAAVLPMEAPSLALPLALVSMSDMSVFAVVCTAEGAADGDADVCPLVIVVIVVV